MAAEYTGDGCGEVDRILRADHLDNWQEQSAVASRRMTISDCSRGKSKLILNALSMPYFFGDGIRFLYNSISMPKNKRMTFSVNQEFA